MVKLFRVNNRILGSSDNYDSNGNFRARFKYPIEIKPGSKIGLLNAGISLDQNFIVIDDTNNSFRFSVDGGDVYRTVNLINGTYGRADFKSMVEWCMNSSLVFTGVLQYNIETGFAWSIPKYSIVDNVLNPNFLEIMWKRSDPLSYIGATDMILTNCNYNNGIITSTGNDQTWRSYMISKQFFNRGSGILQTEITNFQGGNNYKLQFGLTNNYLINRSGNTFFDGDYLIAVKVDWDPGSAQLAYYVGSYPYDGDTQEYVISDKNLFEWELVVVSGVVRDAQLNDIIRITTNPVDGAFFSLKIVRNFVDLQLSPDLPKPYYTDYDNRHLKGAVSFYNQGTTTQNYSFTNDPFYILDESNPDKPQHQFLDVVGYNPNQTNLIGNLQAITPTTIIIDFSSDIGENLNNEYFGFGEDTITIVDAIDGSIFPYTQIGMGEGGVLNRPLLILINSMNLEGYNSSIADKSSILMTLEKGNITREPNKNTNILFNNNNGFPVFLNITNKEAFTLNSIDITIAHAETYQRIPLREDLETVLVFLILEHGEVFNPITKISEIKNV